MGTIIFDDLIALEKLLNLPLFDSTRPLSYPDGFFEYIDNQGGNDFGVLVRLDSQANAIKKLAALPSAIFKMRNLSQALRQNGHAIELRLAVYPEICNPVTVFPLGTPAEKYINRFVLPEFPRSVNGFFRKFIMKFVKFHPSVAGLILVARKV